MRRVGWVFGVLLVGCGAPAAASTSAATSAQAACADRSAIEAWTGAERAGPGSRTLRRSADAEGPAYRTVRIRRPVDGLARRGPRIDVRLERARLSHAFRFLAEAADMGIVIGEGLDSEITVDLRRVRPVEAMRAIADAHRVELSVVGRTIVARRRP